MSKPARTEMAHQAREELLRRFLEQVQRPADSDACWLWVDRPRYPRPDRAIYPYGSFAGRPAHRMAYWFFRGEIPDGHVVHHRCENKRCVNPDHLEAVLASRHLSEHGRARFRADRQRREQAGITEWSFQMLFEAMDSPEGSE